MKTMEQIKREFDLVITREGDDGGQREFGVNIVDYRCTYEATTREYDGGLYIEDVEIEVTDLALYYDGQAAGLLIAFDDLSQYEQDMLKIKIADREGF